MSRGSRGPAGRAGRGPSGGAGGGPGWGGGGGASKVFGCLSVVVLPAVVILGLLGMAACRPHSPASRSPQAPAESPHPLRSGRQAATVTPP